MPDTPTRRIVSIDVLRGLTMGLMIFCAAIAYDSGLPAWMFHCQVPPPDYVFHPEVRGITWVDLVFPFFLFSMGAAFPFAIRRRMDKGASGTDIILFLLKRWITLVLFSLVIANAGNISAWDGSDILKGIFLILVWAGFFLSLVRTRNKAVTHAGHILILALMAAEWLYFKIPLSLHNTDIIIMILSAVALTGGIVWLFTRDNMPLRVLIWLAIVGIKALTSYTSALDFLKLPDWITWLFDWGFLQYLVIIIPASITGDILHRSGISRQSGRTSVKNLWAELVAVLAVIFQLIGLYNRLTVIDLGVTASLFGAFVLLNGRRSTRFAPVGHIGFILTLAGVLFDFADGGIAKDYCNLSYLFTTCGMASLMTYVLLQLESNGWKGGFLARSGQNPMIAYTICWFLICPLLYGIGLLGWIDSLATGSIFWGLFRGAVVTALMYILTGLCTRLGIFWRN